MHPNPAFHTADDRQNLDFARDRAFGTLAVSVPNAPPLLSHVPFLLSQVGDVADLHLMRSNPIARAVVEPLPARLAVTGPDAYLSPDWYGIGDQVPTWNYVAVHLSGRLERLPDADLPDLLARLSSFFEARLAPKPQWTMDKVGHDTLERLMRMILPVRLHVADVDGTWKLSQNKPDAARLSAAGQLNAAAGGAETEALAKLMRRG